MHEGIVSKSLVYFTNIVPSVGASVGPEPLKLKKILDMVTIAIGPFYGHS